MTEWQAFLTHAAAMQSMIDDFVAVTGCAAPDRTTDLDIGDVITNPATPLAVYLFWITLSHWGTDDVPEDFLAAAKSKWPNLRSNVML
jgi:hypothetical protein